jgi:hypothetical protein
VHHGVASCVFRNTFAVSITQMTLGAPIHTIPVFSVTMHRAPTLFSVVAIAFVLYFM